MSEMRKEAVSGVETIGTNSYNSFGYDRRKPPDRQTRHNQFLNRVGELKQDPEE